MTAKVARDSAPAPLTDASSEKPYTLAFELAGLPKMANQLLRGHWRVKHAHAMKWKLAVSLACHGVKPRQPLRHAALTLTRVSSVEPDYDGLVSSFKHVIDGLVEAGVLQSDKMSAIGRPDYRWERCSPRKGCVRVKVEEVRP